MNSPATVRTVAALLLMALAPLARGQEAYEEVRRFSAPEATQAVAVDANHFYAIANTVIAKYEKKSGKRVKVWKSDEDHPLKHLNSGLVRDGKLYCAHSNYPNYPEASSVEIWDAESLEHLESHSLGVLDGSLTWVDWRDGAWWVVLAHYNDDKNELRDHRWTMMLKMDKQWRRMGGWIFPDNVLDQFKPHSCSGGGWSPDGRLLCSGHDRGELYWLEVPKSGSTLRWKATIPCPITGQGVAFDPSEQGVLYGIDRPKRQVVVARLRK